MVGAQKPHLSSENGGGQSLGSQCLWENEWGDCGKGRARMDGHRCGGSSCPETSYSEQRSPVSPPASEEPIAPDGEASTD